MEGPQRSRRRRGSISRQEIIDAAMRLLDREGEAALTFIRLGQELKASPTAVYRHFASRHDVLIAIADHLDGLSLNGYEPTDEWRSDLDELAWRAWRTAAGHPAAAGIALSLITNGMNELAAVDFILRALHMAGLRGRDAVIQYQVYTNLVMGAAATHGSRNSSDAHRTQEGWAQVYTPPDPSLFPYAEAVKSELRHIDYDEVFGRQLQMYFDALAGQLTDTAERLSIPPGGSAPALDRSV